MMFNCCQLLIIYRLKNITIKTPNTAKTHAKRIPSTYISRLSDDANDAIIASLISKKKYKICLKTYASKNLV